MKTVIISHLWPRRQAPHLGVFVAEQVAALKQRCDISVIVPVDLTPRSDELSFRELYSGFSEYRRRTRPELLPIPGVTISTVFFRSPLKRAEQAEMTAQRLAAALHSAVDWDADLIHAHTLFPDGLGCALWLKNSKKPLLVTAHGSDVHSISPGVKKALPALLQRADAIIPVSNFLKERLIAFGANPNRLHTLPNGFPAEQFTALPSVTRNPKKIAFLGRLSDVKRIDLLIQALSFLSPEITLDIAGAGPLRKMLEALTRSLKLHDRVNFLGMIARAQVSEFLSGAALLCLVSRREGWPTVVFESFACGTPVLATAVGGLPEAIALPDLGVLVPDEIIPEELAAAIEKALSRVWDRELIRQHALNYTWERNAGHTFELYQRILSKQRQV